MKKINKIQKKISLCAAILVTVLCCSSKSFAQENAGVGSAAMQQNTIMSIVESVNALAKPKEDAPVVQELKEGDTVVVTDNMDNGWSQILWDGQEAYVPSAKIVEPPINEALVKEMEAMAAQEAVDIEAYERQRKEALRAKIWGIVIAVLIIGIFGMGIVSTMKASKETEMEKRKKELLVLELEEEEDSNRPV